LKFKREKMGMGPVTQLPRVLAALIYPPVNIGKSLTSRCDGENHQIYGGKISIGKSIMGFPKA
jgi:hypothetical protein